MKSASNIVSAIHALRQAYDHFEVFGLEHPNTKGAMLFSMYNKKIAWIYRDISTHPDLPPTVLEGLKAEWNSDVFSVPAIAEKVARLNPEQREKLEIVVDALLKGETFEIINCPE